jgi:hypothetical protein
LFIKTYLVRYITFKFASAITLFPFVFVDDKVKLTRRLVQHEKIHLLQQAELLVIPFYFLYILNHFLNLFTYSSTFESYKNIIFERECFANESVANYLETRKVWSWLKYTKDLQP